ncbi:hypothetical protein GDO78_019545 [Eleutherodactylus coqui]|uniref:Uncharacterized protein n=1 Tax=Eleutherodactylus coqui TaxID=57060 RepID=A0A8J6BB84_ELECQ|nr:hypothetical protein GDO78_019545 [Eleutherodactylus coqui]
MEGQLPAPFVSVSGLIRTSWTDWSLWRRPGFICMTLKPRSSQRVEAQWFSATKVMASVFWDKEGCC